MSNIIQIKRRISGSAGAPAYLSGGELAFNEVSKTLYYGANSANGGVIAIGGEGAFATSEHNHPTDLDLLFTAATSANFQQLNYTPTGDISAVEVYSDALKTMMIYSRTITYDLSGNITTITTTDQRTPSKYLIKSVTYSGSGDIANVTSSYYGF